MNMKNRTLYCFLGLFALGVSCTSVSSEEDMYALALKKNPALRHVLELYEGDSLKQQAALFLKSNHSWLIWSKPPFMSPSKIHSGEYPFRRML